MPRNPYIKWVVLALAALAFYLSSEDSRSYWKRKRYHKHLENTLQEMKASNDRLEKEVSRLKSDPGAIEKIARSELGLIKPGEIEYRFIQERAEANSK